MADPTNGETHLIRANDVRAELQHYHLSNGVAQVRTTGTVTARTYEKQNVVKFWFKADADSGIWAKSGEYDLGPATEAYKMLDHREVIKPLIDRGFEFTGLGYWDGGLTVWAMLRPPDPIIIDDVIGWDSGIVMENRRTEQRTLEEGILVQSSLKPRSLKIHYRAGWFRPWIGMGLVGQRLLSLPSFSYAHRDWSAGRVVKSMESLRETTRQIVEADDFDPRGELLGNSEGAGLLAGLISRYVVSDSDMQERILAGLPYVVREAIRPFTYMTDWHRTRFVEVLEMMAEADVDVYSLDAINAVTAPVAMLAAEETVAERTSWVRGMVHVPRVVKATAYLIAMHNLMSEV
jgi:hypothetical protein